MSGLHTRSGAGERRKRTLMELVVTAVGVAYMLGVDAPRRLGVGVGGGGGSGSGSGVGVGVVAGAVVAVMLDAVEYSFTVPVSRYARTVKV